MQPSRNRRLESRSCEETVGVLMLLDLVDFERHLGYAK